MISFFPTVLREIILKTYEDDPVTIEVTIMYEKQELSMENIW